VDSRQTTAPCNFGQVGLAGWDCESLPGLLRLHRSENQVVEHREIALKHLQVKCQIRTSQAEGEKALRRLLWFKLKFLDGAD
jgi:hypothetical protein